MNRPLFKRFMIQVGTWAAMTVLCVAIALAQDSASPNPQRTDGQIEMDVVHALDASAALKNDLITAATIQGQVTLSGTVSSEDSKKLADSIVKGVPGVIGVKDNLKVGNPANDPNYQGAQTASNDVDVPDAGSANQTPPPAPGDYSQNNQNQPNYGNQAPPPYGQQPDYGQQPPYGHQPQYGELGPPPPYGQAPPPPPGYGSNPYPPQYRGAAPTRPPYKFATNPVTVPGGTLIQVRTSEAVNSKRAKGGEPVQFTVIQDVTYAGVLAIPRGAIIHGVIAQVNHLDSGEIKGSEELALELTSLDLGGQTYPIQSDLFKVKGPGKGGRTAESAFGGALLGAIIGGAAGGGGGAAIGAVSGGAVGTAASAAAPAGGAWIPAEALVTFHLAEPVTVDPVSQEEAMRLAEGLYPGGPTLYRRGYYGRPYGYYAPYPYPYHYPYPYYYGPVYYRPYYVVGGAYYWR